MIKKKQNHVNFLSTENLNRFSEFRTNKNWIGEKLKSSSSLIIPVSNMKNLFMKGDDPQPVFLTSTELEKFYPSSYVIFFLGEIDELFYFAADFSCADKIDNELLLTYGELIEFRKIMSLINPDKASILSYARALSYWHSRNKFCGVCSTKTEIVDAGHKIICTNNSCKAEYFPRTDPAIIVLVSKGDECLLARQKHWSKGQYSTIAGFVEPGESLEQAVKREVNEETGVIVDKIQYHSSQPWSFPSALMLGFHAVAKNKIISPRDNELEEVRWFSRAEIIKSFSDKTFRFPTRVSVSFSLLEHWFNKYKGKPLAEIVDDMS